MSLLMAVYNSRQSNFYQNQHPPMWHHQLHAKRFCHKTFVTTKIRTMMMIMMILILMMMMMMMMMMTVTMTAMMTMTKATLVVILTLVVKIALTPIQDILSKKQLIYSL